MIGLAAHYALLENAVSPVEFLGKAGVALVSGCIQE